MAFVITERENRIDTGAIENPLVRYLRIHKICQADLANKMSEIKGWKVHQSMISMWSTGYRIPNVTSRALIKEATDGWITEKDWDKWYESNFA